MMKAPIGILLILMLLSSCGLPFGQDSVKKSGFRMYSTTNPAFSSHIQNFESKAKSELGLASYSIGDVPINFGDTEDPKFDGVCFTYPNGQKEVVIKKAWWDGASPTAREVLIFHELGHCALGRTGHTNGTISHGGNTFKLSIMHEKVPRSVEYNQFKSGYHNELFHKNDGSLQNQIKQLTASN